MENKRSNRRFRTRNAIKRRIKKYIHYDILVVENYRMTNEIICSNAEKEKYVFDGRGYQFLRTTGSPCNCFCCSGMFKYRTYRAKEKREVEKIIKELIKH